MKGRRNQGRSLRVAMKLAPVEVFLSVILMGGAAAAPETALQNSLGGTVLDSPCTGVYWQEDPFSACVGIWNDGDRFCIGMFVRTPSESDCYGIEV